MQKISVSEFRQKCLALLDDLPSDGLLLTRHVQPVARIFPLVEKHAALIGILPDQIMVDPSDDLFSTGER